MPPIVVCILVAVILGGTLFAIVRRNRAADRNQS